MRTVDEIQNRLDMAQSQMEDCQKWHDDACKRYQSDKQFWGKDADRGEMDHSGDELRTIKKEVSLLKWILATDTNETLKEKETLNPV